MKAVFLIQKTNWLICCRLKLNINYFSESSSTFTIKKINIFSFFLEQYLKHPNYLTKLQNHFCIQQVSLFEENPTQIIYKFPVKDGHLVHPFPL